ncbi:MAG TPA: bifunctional hydroxymethylpyrimidine kinase/phosphomethylpyrimidine kinase [Edaphobacter sp.]
MKTLLTIAGYDPSSGAVITADLLTFAAHGHFGTSAITSLTVQSTKGVLSSHPVSASTLSATLDCLEDDLPPAGIKLGMLATAELVHAVADYLEGVRQVRPDVQIVLDPVLRSTSGRELLSVEGLSLLDSRLLPLVDWVTPNLAELSLLADQPVMSRSEMESAAHSLQSRLPRLGVLATGGHIDPPDDLLLLAGSDSIQWITGQRIESTSTHGTGCALSSALLSQLAHGTPPVEAARAAKEYVAQAIRSATPLGHGHGPLNHLWPLYKSG